MQDALVRTTIDLAGTGIGPHVTDLQNQVRRTGHLPQGDKSSRLESAAHEFEALFAGYMLKVMRESIEESGLSGKGLGQDIYTELFDQEVARFIATRGALGISDMLVHNLAAGQSPVEGGQGKGPARQARPENSVPDASRLPEEEVPDFRMPLHAHVSSTFGPRDDPFTHKMRLHKGLDIAAPEGMEVRAACGGQVLYAGYEKGYGNTVLVQHRGGFQTRYAHLGSLCVRAGDSLLSEQVLGKVGSTGRSTGPHLHFEVSRHGEQMDPERVLAD